MKKEDKNKNKQKTQQQQNKSDGEKKLEWQINFLIIIYTVLQIYTVYGEGCLRRYRRGNLHHYSVRDYNHSSKSKSNERARFFPLRVATTEKLWRASQATVTDSLQYNAHFVTLHIDGTRLFAIRYPTVS